MELVDQDGVKHSYVGVCEGIPIGGNPARPHRFYDLELHREGEMGLCPDCKLSLENMKDYIKHQ
jgi:hypothetical protein